VAQAHIDLNYASSRDLWETRLDGLIVTGTEPRASRLEDEPYWLSLTKLIDWAEGHTISTVWSCLAAHAMVLHLDGIHRQPLPRKLSGVFACVKSADHEIIADFPDRWHVPHSRDNGVPEELLVQRGYQMLARSADTGADLFIKNRNSLFVCFHGHPEYEPDTLLREYRRDTRRFLAGERHDYPEMPSGYFDLEAAAALTAFREQALSDHNPALIARFPTASIEEKLSYQWREPALSIYSHLSVNRSSRETYVAPNTQSNSHRQA
jgi:homoserine O-succinyltransferase